MPLPQLVVLLSSDPVLVLLLVGSFGVTIALVLQVDPLVKESSRSAPCTVFSAACSSVSTC